jgi:pantoate kinase
MHPFARKRCTPSNCQQKVERAFAVEVKDQAGNVVAQVHKVLHVRNKDPVRTPA